MATEPFLSIIVPTYERPGPLMTCLGALANLDYPRDRFEVIVVDDGSATPPQAALARFRHTLNARLLLQVHAGPAAARNTGAGKAEGQFLVFTDDDCIAAPDWLQALAAKLTRAPRGAVGGRTLNLLIRNPYSIASQAIVDLVYAYYNADPNGARFFASNNLALPADEFRAVGGFDTSFATSEDRDLCDRWRYHGYPMTYAPEAVVYHEHPLTLRAFWRQHFNYGRGAFRFHCARARRGSGAFRPDLIFHLRLLRHRFPPGTARGPRWATMLVWQLANTAGFVREALNGRVGTDAMWRSENR